MMHGLETQSTPAADRYESIQDFIATSPIEGAYYPPRERDFLDLFYDALGAWRNETAHSSSIQQITQSRHLQKIVDLGSVVAPLIVHELSRRPDFLFVALQRITGENPVPATARGNVRKMVDAWLLWAEHNL